MTRFERVGSCSTRATPISAPVILGLYMYFLLRHAQLVGTPSIVVGRYDLNVPYGFITPWQNLAHQASDLPPHILDDKVKETDRSRI
jgi:hypothetical protein